MSARAGYVRYRKGNSHFGKIIKNKDWSINDGLHNGIRQQEIILMFFFVVVVVLYGSTLPQRIYTGLLLKRKIKCNVFSWPSFPKMWRLMAKKIWKSRAFELDNFSDVFHFKDYDSDIPCFSYFCLQPTQKVLRDRSLSTFL
jgi:hypothetical protein